MPLTREQILMKALADTVNKRLVTFQQQGREVVANAIKDLKLELASSSSQPRGPTEVNVPPSINLPPQHVHNEVPVPEVNITNDVAAPEIVVQVDMAPVAEALDRMTGALLAQGESLSHFAEMLAQAVQLLADMPAPQVTVEQPPTEQKPPQVTVKVPDRPKRKLKVEHSDGTKTWITEE